METYGDLRKAIKLIQLKQKGVKIGDVAIDTIIGNIPGIGQAKSVYDLVKAAYSTPDDTKMKNWIGQLDVDDEYSAIVDDTIENGFLQTIARKLEKKPDNTPLEPDFNMNDELTQYISNKHEKRTVTGIRESKLKNTMEKLELKQLIREALLEQVPEETPDKESEKLSGPILSFTQKMADLDSSIDTSLLKQAITLLANGKGITQIKHKDEVVKTFNAMMKSGDPSAISKVFMTLKQLKVQ
jgi:hypothetical protein